MVTVESEDRRRAESRLRWWPRRFEDAYMAEHLANAYASETSQKQPL